jgi:hypothetical protein
MKKLFSEDGGECAILTVHAEHKDYAVAAPSYEASIGHICEFRVADNMTMIGMVMNLVHCKQFDETWNTIASFTGIHDAVAIYEIVWNGNT